MERTIEERVAVLEERMDRDDADRAERRRELDAQLTAVRHALESSTAEMARYKGIVGGISLAISVLWAGAIFLRESIVGWLSR